MGRFLETYTVKGSGEKVDVFQSTDLTYQAYSSNSHVKFQDFPTIGKLKVAIEKEMGEIEVDAKVLDKYKMKE